MSLFPKNVQSAGPSVVAPTLANVVVPSPTVFGLAQRSLANPLPGSVWQVALQPSPLVVLPSSHCSPADAFTIASPHRAVVQLLLHVADSPPVSHCSPFSTLPLPQTGVVPPPPLVTKVAVIDVICVPSTTSGLACGLGKVAPDQLSNCQPAAGTGVSVTLLPLADWLTEPLAADGRIVM